MDKRAYEHMVGMVLDKKAGFWDGFKRTGIGRNISGKVNAGLNTLRNYKNQYVNDAKEGLNTIADYASAAKQNMNTGMTSAGYNLGKAIDAAPGVISRGYNTAANAVRQYGNDVLDGADAVSNYAQAVGRGYENANREAAHRVIQSGRMLGDIASNYAQAVNNTARVNAIRGGQAIANTARDAYGTAKGQVQSAIQSVGDRVNRTIDSGKGWLTRGLRSAANRVERL